MFPRITPSPVSPLRYVATLSGELRDREPLEAPTAFERVRGAGYGLLAPLRHLIEIVSVGAVTSVVGAPEPVVLLVTGVAAGGSALIGLVGEAITPTRPATSAPVPIATSFTSRADAQPGAHIAVPRPPRSELMERVLDSEWTRAAGFIGAGSALTAAVLAAISWPVALPLVLAGGLSFGLVGLIAKRKLDERNSEASQESATSSRFAATS